MNILCIINDGFEETETTAPIDILLRAGHKVDIVSNKTEAKGAHGIIVSNLTLITEIDTNSYDLLLLPGGPHWKQNQDDEKYLKTILDFKDKAIAAICASPTILGKLGLLQNKNYTCFPPMNDDFKGTFTGSDAIIDGNIITGRSAGSSLEFGFKILEYIDGVDKTNSIKESMYY